MKDTILDRINVMKGRVDLVFHMNQAYLFLIEPGTISVEPPNVRLLFIEGVYRRTFRGLDRPLFSRSP